MSVELEKIIAVSGKGGLFKMVNSGKSAIVAESLVDGKRVPVMTSAKVSSLSDISIFCVDEDIPLRTVLLTMKELYGDKQEPDPKSDSKVLKSTMKKILPNYDSERVYDSDIRKLFLWFSILKSRDMLEFAEPEEEAEAATGDE